MSDKQIALRIVNGQEVSLPSFDGILSKRGTPMGARKWVGARFGVEVVKGMKMPDVKAAAIAAGKTEDEFKLARKEYDKQTALFYTQSRAVNALYAADPNHRQAVRLTKTGAVTTYRKLAAGTAKIGATARIAQLEALLAKAGITAPTAA